MTNYQSYDVYKREKYLSTILSRFDWYPKLLYYNDEKQFFIFENVGNPLNNNNKPKDLKIQFEKILSDMKKVKVKHNDIKIGELLVNNKGKVFLCDFGWASVNGSLGCGIGICNKQKPAEIFDDITALKRLKLL